MQITDAANFNTVKTHSTTYFQTQLELLLKKQSKLFIESKRGVNWSKIIHIYTSKIYNTIRGLYITIGIALIVFLTLFGLFTLQGYEAGQTYLNPTLALTGIYILIGIILKTGQKYYTKVEHGKAYMQGIKAD